MYNDEVFQIIVKNEGCTVPDIIKLLGIEYSGTHRDRVQRQLRSLIRYDIIRIEKITNPNPKGRSEINAYYLTESTLKELKEYSEDISEKK